MFMKFLIDITILENDMDNVLNEIEKNSISDIDDLIKELVKIKESIGNCSIIVDDNCGGYYKPSHVCLLKSKDEYLVEIS